MARGTAYQKYFPITTGTIILASLSLLGLAMAILRWVLGLGAITALSDGRPWGLWISFDILCGVALGAGAFTIAATIYIFRVKRFYPLMRPTILTGFLGYVLVIIALLVDLGFPYRIWHLLIYWNVHSPLFEIGWCVMIYTTVLALEFSPAVFERLNQERPMKVIRSVTIPLVILGIVLSICHQSTLGTLFIIMPHRLNPLWYSPFLPVFFFISAVAAGLSMIIIESTISSNVFRRYLELDLLSDIAKAIPYVLGLYLVIKIGDVAAAGELNLLMNGSLHSTLFLIEILIGVIIPMVLFAIPTIRKNRQTLFWVSMITIFGLMLNRFNLSLNTINGAPYFPSWSELALTIGLVAGGMLVFRLAVYYLPVFGEPLIKEAAQIQESQKQGVFVPALGVFIVGAIGLTYMAGSPRSSVSEPILSSPWTPTPAPTIELAADTTDNAGPTWNGKVGALFEATCVSCHPGMAAYDGVLTGSDAGEWVIPGDADASPLVQIHTDGHAGQFSDEQLAYIKTWIDAGAPEGEAGEELAAITTGSPEASAEAAEGPDYCVECHTDKETLIAVAEAEEEEPEESSGPG